MTEVRLEGGGRAVRVPVTQLHEGDEFWGDTYEPENDRIGISPSMHYRLLESFGRTSYGGDLPPGLIGWMIEWADGGREPRVWDSDRYLVVRRAYD